MASPSLAIRLVRISDARDDDTHGVDGQAEDLLDYGGRIGWGFGPESTHLLIENDTSAFKRRMVCRACLRPARECKCPPAAPGEKHPTVLRTWRPKFRLALDMLRDGRADGLLTVDLDRACRDLRDLEDLIDVVESRKPRVPVDSKAGSLRLANDADVTMARVMVTVANKSSRDTRRRVSGQHQKDAAAGKYRGGKRRYGWEPDGVTPRPFEQEIIRWGSESVLAGVSLRFLVRHLTEHHVPTVTGAPWSTTTFRGILLRASNAGLSVWTDPETGEQHEYAAQWPAIIPVDEWRAVVAILTDPARRTSPGNKPRWLGSLLYLCGACEEEGKPLTEPNGYSFVKVSGGSEGREAYMCAAASAGVSHLRRAAGTGSLEGQVHGVDDFVSRVIVARLAKPEAAILLPHDGNQDVDVRALRAEQATLRELLNEQARLHARRIIDDQQLAAGSIELREKLDAIGQQLEETAGSSPLAGIAGNPDAAAVWARMDLGRRREIIRALMTVTLLPMEKLRGRVFDPASVRIDWRRALPGEENGE